VKKGVKNRLAARVGPAVLGKKLCYSVMVLLGNLVHALFALLSFGYSVTVMLGFWV
jgi:hypothetical protein